MYKNFNFEILSQKDSARRGVITTPHGQIQTPAFIFCGTKASVKGIAPKELRDLKTQIILSNTYHLFVYPGSKYIKTRGGLHKFMGWDGPILTDSGGFQIFSLGHGAVAAEIKGHRTGTPTLLKIDEEGAFFKSYWDGSINALTPEKSIEVQRDLGVDFVVAFDECTPFHSDYNYTKASMERSHRWETRSLKEFQKFDDETQAIYGIVQGGVHRDLRKISANFVSENDFFATAIGGSLGSTKEQMFDVVGMALEYLNTARPIHLLGIGGISDIFKGVELGIDTFDCVHPTRIARHGGALVKPKFRDSESREHLNLKRAEYANQDTPIESDCTCSTCQTFSRAYLHYLLKAKELLAIHAITTHNIFFMNRLMEEIRTSLESNTFDEIRNTWQG